MRTLLLVMLAAAVGVIGCKNGPWQRPDARVPYNGTPTADQVVAHLNQNARAVQSIQYGDVDIQAKQGTQSFAVDGLMFYQKPRNFRLKAEGGGVPQADFGSNNQEFWFWIRQDKANAIYRCTYEDLPRISNLKIPLNPEWICEALCVQELGDPRHYQMKTVGNAVEMTSQAVSPQGAPMQKVLTVATTGPLAGRITAMRLRSNQGTEIWSAEVTEYHTNVPGHHAIPRKVKVKCPAENFEISFKLDQPQVNTIQAGKTGNLFTRPEIVGYQVIDLARGSAQTQSQQRIRGSVP
jgi:hypothetical protein